MKWPFKINRTEKKAGSPLVQYQSGIYHLGSSTAGSQRLKQYIEGYRICDTIYSCVNLIVQSAVLVPWYVYRDKPDGEVEEIEKHPLMDWMKKPGPGMDWTEFLTRSLSFYLTAGNSYTHKMIGSFGKYGQVEVLRPHLMTIKAERGEITAYEYRVAGQVITFNPEEIIHVKTFHPEDPLYGLSPLQVLARKIDISQFGELWTTALLENEARPSGALKIKSGGPLSEDQRDKLNQILKDQISGYENAGKPLILQGDWEWVPFSITPKELEFLHSKKAVMREICAAYKVAPELFGDSENKTYSNIKEARKALYQEAVLPLLGKFKNAINEQIVPAFDASGVYLDYDVSGIDALSEDLDLLWKRLLDAKNSGTITRNEARLEMNYEELPGPDMLSENVSVISTPVDQLGKEPEPEPEPAKPIEEPPEEEPPKTPKKVTLVTKEVTIKGGFWQKAERKEAKWNAFARRVQARERGIQKIAAQHLHEQAERIVKQVKKAPTVNMIDRWRIIDKEKEAGLFVDASIRWYIDSFTKAVRSGMAAGKGEISDGEEKTWIFNPKYEAALRKIVIESGTKIAATTMEDILGLLEQAELENQTVAEFAKSIQALMGERETWRARRIAQTEAGRVENYGELEGYRQTEFVTLKGWLCSFLEHSREAHIKADADYSNDPIPLDDPFHVGGEELMAPLDESLGATAGNIIQCHCTTYPQVEEV